MEPDPTPKAAQWTFLTNHARVLVQIARDPGIRVRDIASHCLLTERAVLRIIADLEEAGYLSHTRAGRRSRYRLVPGKKLRHPADAGPTVAELLAALTTGPAPEPLDL
ncbi:helix-turn-helix transcriptional regulator [Streptacidiphilus neutrinimicus]|uniref:helix-turn-helix transcriptional regulator n=1 Tax=Streptacidiphilus neutrinimicus TaxID=105420 RepID=UPI0005A8C796|nr:winged helix-turn-helix domain-containing protein [Streptacidiphilus neutrinimicus]